MATATMDSAKSQESQAERPLPIRLRPDLVASRQLVRGTTRWAVKDPVALQYYHFGEREWFLLRQLDGSISLAELQRRFAQKFAPFQISTAELSVFLRRTHSDGLVLFDQHGHGAQLFGKAKRIEQQQRAMRLLSILAIRFKGIDPHRLLGWLSPVGSALFHPVTFAFAVMIVVVTAIFGIVQAQTISDRMPDLHWFLQGENLLWMMVALGIVKVLHEIGHGLACRHFGGECHEMGLMFLVFTPCLYCNVSDAWMLPNRWHRIIISAAGIYVELMLAAACFAGWYFTHPGILNAVLLNVVIVCSINTLFLNGNPLLRYDGYYILSDLIEIPNLAAQARQAIWGPLAAWLTKGNEDVELPRLRWGLITYGISSIIYRCMVVTTIIWFVHRTLKSYDMEVIGQMVIAIILLGLVIPLGMQVRRVARNPRSLAMVRWGRFAAVGVGMLLLAGAVLTLPFPAHVTAPVAIEAAGAAHVYAPAPGRLLWAAPIGTELQPGDLVCEIENRDLEREREAIQESMNEYRVLIDSLKLQLSDDATAGIRLTEAESELGELEARLAVVKEDLQRLDVTTQVGGLVVRARPRNMPTDPARVLPTWQGTPADAENRGCFVDRGELICLVGTEREMRIVMYVGQESIDRIRIDDLAEIQLNQDPTKTYPGKVMEISREEVQAAPEAMAAAEDFAVRPDEVVGLRPVQTSYRVVIALEQQPDQLLLHSSGRGRIKVEPSSFGSRLLGYLRRTLRFEI